MNAMLISSGAPQNLWGEAILTANSILNKVSHKKLKRHHINYEKKEMKKWAVFI